MTVVHILKTSDGELRVEDPDFIRVEREGEHEFYVIILCDFEETAYSLHDHAKDAERIAAALAKRLRCEWGVNIE